MNKNNTNPSLFLKTRKVKLTNNEKGVLGKMLSYPQPQQLKIQKMQINTRNLKKIRYSNTLKRIKESQDSGFLILNRNLILLINYLVSQQLPTGTKGGSKSKLIKRFGFCHQISSYHHTHNTGTLACTAVQGPKTKTKEETQTRDMSVHGLTLPAEIVFEAANSKKVV